jgi:hypothetical protein
VAGSLSRLGRGGVGRGGRGGRVSRRLSRRQAAAAHRVLPRRAKAVAHGRCRRSLHQGALSCETRGRPHEDFGLDIRKAGQRLRRTRRQPGLRLSRRLDADPGELFRARGSAMSSSTPNRLRAPRLLRLHDPDRERLRQEPGEARLARHRHGIWSEVTNAAYSPVLRKPNRFQTRIQFLEKLGAVQAVARQHLCAEAARQPQCRHALYVLDRAG